MYAVHPAPEKIIERIIARQYSSLGPASAARPDCDRLLAPVTLLARLLFLVGQAAVCTLVLLEKLAKEAKKANEKNRSVPHTVSDPLEGRLQGEGSQPVDDAGTMEEEMGLAAAADAEHDKVQYACYSFMDLLYCFCLFVCLFV